MKEKSKLNTILLIVLGVLVVSIIVVAVILHGINKKNEAAFVSDMQQMCEKYNVSLAQNSEAYIVKISPDSWTGKSDYQHKVLCEAVYLDIMTSLWNNHIYNQNSAPIVWFYVDNTMVASGGSGSVKLK